MQIADTTEQSDKNKDTGKKKKLRQPLASSEKVLVLAEKLKKKDVPGRLYKSTTKNTAFFNIIGFQMKVKII